MSAKNLVDLLASDISVFFNPLKTKHFLIIQNLPPKTFQLVVFQQPRTYIYDVVCQRLPTCKMLINTSSATKDVYIQALI